MQLDLNVAYDSIVETELGQQELAGLYNDMTEGVPGIHMRAALLRRIGTLMRLSYAAGHTAGVVEQLTTVEGR